MIRDLAQLLAKHCDLLTNDAIPSPPALSPLSLSHVPLVSPLGLVCTLYCTQSPVCCIISARPTRQTSNGRDGDMRGRERGIHRTFLLFMSRGSTFHKVR